jgi:hypothetical protein
MPLNKQFAKFSLTPLSALIVPALLAQKPSEHAAQPPTSAQQHFPTYEDVTEQCKIRFQHSFGEQKLSSILEATGSGCVWFDYNNDGLLDLYVLSGRYLEGVTDHSHPDGADATNHLYRNNGDGTFTDVTTQAGVAGKGFAMGVTVGDYDNDGYEDIYVTNWNSVILYHNNGDGTFTDVTEKAGVQNSHWGVGAAFLDYDRDGRLDLFVGNYLKFDPHAKKPYYGAEAFAGPLDFEGDANRLFHNNGDGTFTDVSAQAGVDNAAGRAKGVTVADFDNDGWPDIYVANDQMESYLYATITTAPSRTLPSIRTLPTAPTATRPLPWARSLPTTTTTAPSTSSSPTCAITACSEIPIRTASSLAAIAKTRLRFCRENRRSIRPVILPPYTARVVVYRRTISK